MRQHPGEIKLQIKACGALRNIARNHDQNRAVIIREQGLQLILAAIRLHPEHAMLQSEACRTLYSLARNGKEY
jgi:hypothetical protein